MHEQKIGKRPIVRKGGKPKLTLKSAFGKAQGGFQKTGTKRAAK